MSLPVAALMRRDVVHARMDDTVASVEQTLLAHALTWLPVLDPEDTAVGVISAVDLLRFRAEGRDAGVTRAWQLCHYQPIAVPPDAACATVARLMVERGIHHVVVIDGGRLSGVVSSMDLVRALVP